MTMILFLKLLVAVSWAQNDQPRISTTNGHLTFETGSYKNIEFISSTGKVKINGKDFDELNTQVDSHSQ